ncbi:uncharacterized protein DUF3618 [Actinomadura pelletieri DSM 43383]|uniref:Uncharacterized protein DUF3618 n=1 Tax=Actinomadura pelletieri DSM 43383 TaxID=1120940 RepID=A0A495QTN6_9ACTN|nr:DUF3618 domain-containing protein [Actinomadura pelletieri]RKS76818.1 uncharacterized protein DUF3618 [Actinomadura pelletieri DSM 43383]
MADSARSPDELEREIEIRRQRLARTVDEFAARVSPKNVAQRGTERLKEEAGQVARAVGAIMRPDDAAVEAKDPAGGGPDKRLVLVGVGAAVTVTALILWGRRRRRR